MMTYEQVELAYLNEVFPAVTRRYEADGVPDYPARREAWNDHVDALQKAGEVTAEQANTWLSPAWVSGARRRAR